MSTAYLQRLFDRAAAGPPPQVAPTGPSQSPIAEADQRLNDPALANLFGFGLVGADVAGKGEGMVAALGDIPSSPFRGAAARQPLPQTPVARTAREAVEQDRPVEAMVTKEAGSQSAGLPFAAIGQVFPGDLARPTSVQDGAVQAEPAPDEPRAPAAMAPPRADLGEPALLGPSASPALTVVVDRDPEPAQVMMLPPRTAPQPLATPEPPAFRPEAARPTPPRPEPVREHPPVEAPTAKPASRTRPMTAAEASVIGPLVAELRARTLFGLRRR